MQIGKNIRFLRIINDMGQSDLAKILGVSNTTVSAWETGNATPRMGAIEKLSRHFGVPKSVLIDDDLEVYKIRPPKLDERIIAAINDDKDLYQFVLQLTELPEEQRKKVISTGLFLLRQEKGV